MTDKTYENLTAAITIADADLLGIYPTGGPMKKVTFAVFKALVITALGTTFLVAANNLSDITNAVSARANLGLGSASLLSSGAFFLVANNLAEIGSALQARANIGAAGLIGPAFTGGIGVTGGAVVTGGMSVTGPEKLNVNAPAAGALDLSGSNMFTQSISANRTYTFDNAAAAFGTGFGGAFLMSLTISSSAVPTFPAAVTWENNATPNWANGRWMLGFVTFDGGATFTGKASFVV